MAFVKGSDVLLYVNNTGSIYTVVGGQRDFGLTKTADLIETTNKSVESKTYDYGKLDSTLTLDSVFVEGDVGFAALDAAQAAKTSILVRHYVNGAAIKQASAIVTSINLQAPDNDNYTGSIDLQITGGWSSV